MTAVRAARVAVAAAILLALNGCGTRVSHQAVVDDAGAPVVHLDPASIAALHQATAPAAPEGRHPDAVTASTPNAPAPATGPATTGGQAAAAASPTSGPVSPRHQDVGVKTAAPVSGSRLASSAAGSQCPRALVPVALGQVGTFSGVAGTITASARTAMAVWAQDVNSRGGLACHPVQLYTEDDGGDPARAAAAVQDLVQRRHVVALVDDIVVFSVAGFRPAIETAKLPAIGGDLLEPDWDQSPFMFPQGSGLDDQVVGLVRAGVAAGHKRLGYLYCVEVSACGYVDKRLKGQAASVGAKLVYDAPISITQPDFTAQCLNAKNAGADLLGLGMDGAAMTRVARSCTAVGYRPLLAIGGGGLSAANAADPTLRALGAMSVSAVAPWMSGDTPGLIAYHHAMTTYAPQLTPDGQTMNSWTSGKLLEAAIADLPSQQQAGNLTPALVIEGLDRIHDETLGGLTARLTFTPQESHAVSSGCVWFERLGTDGWAAPNGSRPVCG